MKHHVPSVKEDITSRPDQGNGSVNAVFEKMMESQHTYTPVPFRTLVRNAADSSSWQKVMRQHAQSRTSSRGVQGELMALEKLVRSALDNARQTSIESLEKA